MAGYDLKEESYVQNQLTEDELWSIFSGIFSNKESGEKVDRGGFEKRLFLEYVEDAGPIQRGDGSII